ncbi:MAG: protein translocase subunit SecD, partial [Planctomycetes bacterium]|nr:protein translocase subunit SecD [Planctomycetota bacterium]
QEGGGREAALDLLVRGVDGRKKLLELVAFSYDVRLEAEERVANEGFADDEAEEGAEETEPVDAALALEEAEADYDAQMDDLLAANFPVQRFVDVLKLKPGEARDSEIEKVKTDYSGYDSKPSPDGVGAIAAAIEAFSKWSEDRAELEDPSDLKRRIRGAGVLEFRILADRDSQSPANIASSDPSLKQAISIYTDRLQKVGPRARSGDRFRWLEIQDVEKFMRLDDIEDFDARQPGSQQIIDRYAGRYYVLAHNDSDYGMLRSKDRAKSRWSLRRSRVDQDPMTGEYLVRFTFDPRGGRLFGDFTGRNVQRQLCIVLDDEAVSHATIIQRINVSGQISGTFTLERVQEIVRKLEAGALPARLKETPLVEKTFGPSLGDTNRKAGLFAAKLGVGLVLAFMILYYGFAAGVMADIALILNLLFVLSFMALMQATFTLPGVAGLILTIGMAVDANVLIFERIREERDKGVIFKRALNAGYDKALSTILDANLTTLLICVVLGFFGSEEVKGFAIVLGIGVTTSMFTSLFVTRLAFNTLIARGMLKDLSMRRWVKTPSIDWLALRPKFWTVSMVCVVGGLGLFIATVSTDREAVFDIEFLGGTSVQIDLKPGLDDIDDNAIRKMVTSTGDDDVTSSVEWLRDIADKLDRSDAALGAGAGEQFVVTSKELTGDLIVMLLRGELEDRIVRDGAVAGEHHATIDTKETFETPAMAETWFKKAVARAADGARRAADHLRNARVTSVQNVADEENLGVSYEIVTLEKNRELVQTALLAGIGKDNLRLETAIRATTAKNSALAGAAYFVVDEEHRSLSDVIGGKAIDDIREFKGGVAVAVTLVADEEGRPVPTMSKKAFARRLRETRLQPEFAQYRATATQVFPLGVGSGEAGEQRQYSRFAVLAVDPGVPYTLVEQDRWIDDVAEPLLAQVGAALARAQSLNKVVLFDPQVAGQAQQEAIFAIIVALGAIVAYLWLRFGTKEYGFAAIVALTHDVSITLGLLTLSHYVFDNPIGRMLGLHDFKIDLPMVAALLTVIGYSLNDTIVVFDRIRENRGKVGTLTTGIINTSINQTISRTVLTSFTTFLVVMVLYTVGGRGIHGFSFALLIGIIVGTYSSIGVATPLLYRPQLLHRVMLVIVGFAFVGVVWVSTSDAAVRTVLLLIAGAIIVGIELSNRKKATIVLPRAVRA